MVTTIKYSIAVAALGVLATGCGRAAEKDSQAASAAGTAARPAEPSGPQVSLSGCLEAGTVGETTYLLRNVRYEPGGANDPQRNTTSSPSTGITEGSWVTLVAAPTFRTQIGRRVAITGVVTDDGRSTTGTAGSSGAVVTSGDRSQAASDEHHSAKVKKESGPIARESMANGMAAEIRVIELRDLGELCREAGSR